MIHPWLEKYPIKKGDKYLNIGTSSSNAILRQASILLWQYERVLEILKYGISWI